MGSLASFGVRSCNQANFKRTEGLSGECHGHWHGNSLVMLVVGIVNAPLAHGKTSQLRFSLEETSDADIDLVTATRGGQAASYPVSPYRSNGDQEIVISGRALSRSDNQPVPHARLNLTISGGGFERTTPIVSDDQGAFRFVHTPQAGESGEYRVRVVHPDLSDWPVGAYFVISRLTINPTEINIHIPKNYTQKAKVAVTAGDGTTARNLRLVYQAANQKGMALAPGSMWTSARPSRA